MLTARERERCRELAAALDRGDAETFRRAEPSLTPEMRGEVWDQRAHVKAMAARGHTKPSRTNSGERVSKPAVAVADLDYWSDAPDAEPDDDDPMPVCGACDGTGKDAAGNECAICGGTGRIPAEDQPDDGDDENGDED